MPEIPTGTINERIDALGSQYRLAVDKQQRVEELLAQAQLADKEKEELEAILNEAEAILLRRALALSKVNA
ncbi:MAG TPA: hypothetical protein VFZ34_15710 [Blastocatellia bacterium]|nr:hypothetical protein [Blastocatellia bacterium]